MGDFLKTYAARCKELVEPLGFRRQGSAFARVINDVIQAFTLERYGSGHLCRVVFCVSPLCNEFDRLPLGHLAVRKFEVDGEEDWLYDKHDPESVAEVIEEIIAALKKHLLPFFERADSTKTALSETMAVRRLFEEGRKSWLRARGIKDEAKPEAWMDHLSSDNYYLALKNGDYEYACKCRKLLLNNHLRAYESYQETNESKLERTRKGIQRLQEEVARLEAKDTDYFEKIIRENEAASREFFKRFLIRTR